MQVHGTGAARWIGERALRAVGQGPFGAGDSPRAGDLPQCGAQVRVIAGGPKERLVGWTIALRARGDDGGASTLRSYVRFQRPWSHPEVPVRFEIERGGRPVDALDIERAVLGPLPEMATLAPYLRGERRVGRSAVRGTVGLQPGRWR